MWKSENPQIKRNKEHFRYEKLRVYLKNPTLDREKSKLSPDVFQTRCFYNRFILEKVNFSLELNYEK